MYSMYVEVTHYRNKFYGYFTHASKINQIFNWHYFFSKNFDRFLIFYCLKDISHKLYGKGAGKSE